MRATTTNQEAPQTRQAASPPALILARAWRAKVAATAAILGYYLAGYFALNRLPFAVFHDVPAVPVLDDLPLIPWTVVVYNSVFLLGALGIWLLPRERDVGRHVAATIIAFTVNYVAFAVYPTRIDRPPLPEGPSLWVWVLDGVRGLDAPQTCLPSLHITNCGLAVLALWGTRWGPWSLLWSLAIAASTLTTGQHLFLDLPAGAIPPIIGYAAALWWIPRREKAAPATLPASPGPSARPRSSGTARPDPSRASSR
jgi:hypothetical protein